MGLQRCVGLKLPSGEIGNIYIDIKNRVIDNKNINMLVNGIVRNRMAKVIFVLNPRTFSTSRFSLNVTDMNDLKNMLSNAKGESNKIKPENSTGYKGFEFSRERKGKKEMSYGKYHYGNKYSREELKNGGGNNNNKYKNSHGKNGEGKKGDRYRDKGNRRNEDKERQKAKLLFLESGNDRDKDAAKRIIGEAIKENKKGFVQVIREGGVVEVVNVLDAFKDVKLSEKGITIVGNRNIKTDEDAEKYGLEIGVKMLILKVVDRQVAIKQYGDYLNEQVVEKLKMNNSVILEKQLKNKRDDNSKNNEVKVVQIGWNISLNDLTGQKKFEIENHLKKGHDVEIIIDEREELDRENSSFNSGNNNGGGDGENMEVYAKRRKELNEAERIMRNKMMNIIEENLHELEGLSDKDISQKGYIESRLVMKVKGIDKKKGNMKSDRKEQKRLEKAMKAERNRQRREEKERLAREQMKELNV